MFSHDIIVGHDNMSDGMIVFLITHQARELAVRVFGEGKIERLWDVHLDVVRVRSETASAFVLDAREDGLDAHHHLDLPFMVVVLNAMKLADDARARCTAAAVSAYFKPLLDAAISARDKREITKLFRQMPSLPVEKSFIIDRLKYGADRFDELHIPGVTLDNWHEYSTEKMTACSPETR